jgi:hypothetical protein
MRVPALISSNPLAQAVGSRRMPQAKTMDKSAFEPTAMETSPVVPPPPIPASSESVSGAVPAATEAVAAKSASGVAGFLQNFGPYALMGAFTTALGVGVYEIVQGTSEYIDKSGFPIKDWPNTAEHLNHNHGHGAHAEPGAADNHAGHNHGPAAGGHAQHFGYDADKRQYFPIADGQRYNGRLFHYNATHGEYQPCDPPAGGLFHQPIIPKDAGSGWNTPRVMPKK